MQFNLISKPFRHLMVASRCGAILEPLRWPSEAVGQAGPGFGSLWVHMGSVCFGGGAYGERFVCVLVAWGCIC